MVRVQMFSMDTNTALPGKSCVAGGKETARTAWEEIWLDKETGRMTRMARPAESPQEVSKCFCLYFESLNSSSPGTSQILKQQPFLFAIPY